ncbi:MAG: hypothetical protein AAF385_10905 [Pseudomonadota bacterium]
MKTTMSIAVLVLAFGSCINSARAAEGQDASRTKSAVQTTTRQGATLSAKKASIPVLVATKSARTAPKWAGRTTSASGGPKMLAAPKAELKKVKLTVRKMYTPAANLMFRFATVNSAGNYAFWDKGIQNVAYGYVSAALNVKAGERYLLDFKITANVATTFGINVGDTKQDIAVTKGEHHLLAYLDATETSSVVALLNSDKARYVFHSLTVSRVDN